MCIAVIISFTLLLLLAVGTSISNALSFQQQQISSSSPSLLTTTNEEWKLTLNVGLQPGTWMPKRYPGWAESGGRLIFDAQIQFTDIPIRSGGEKLVGPENETYEVRISSTASCPSKFVSERGEQIVEFGTNIGGWCNSSPQNNNVLRFWLDCSSGAKRRDVEIFPDTRIFFTTSVWDNPKDTNKHQSDYNIVLEKIKALEKKKKNNNKQQNNDDGTTTTTQSNKNIFQNLWSIRELVDDSQELDFLRGLKERYERGLVPPPDAIVASNGLQMAPTGKLVIKGKETPWYIPGSEYLILGTFSTEAVVTTS